MPESQRVSTDAQFLIDHFSHLQESSEVDRVVSRAISQGRKVGRKPVDRIREYLDYLKEITNPDNQDREGRGNIARLKEVLTDRYVLKIDKSNPKQKALMKTYGEEHLERARDDQQASLEAWIDYLVSDQSSLLPDYLKYWVFAGILKLEEYQKGPEGTAGRFPQRPRGKIDNFKQFPEINERGLDFIASAYQSLAKDPSGNSIIFPAFETTEESRDAIRNHLRNKNFRMAYAWVQEFIPPINTKEIQTIDGKWIHFPKGSDGKALSKKLRGKGTNWCIQGDKFAQKYVDEGDLHVYFTYDENGELTVPRVVISYKGKKVREIAGIDAGQNIDKYILNTTKIRDKLQTLPGTEAYIKQFDEIVQGMRHLATIEDKLRRKDKLDANDLRFIYELDRPILFFGYRDERKLERIKRNRNLRIDMATIFNCESDSEQIAFDPSEISPKTIAYVSPLTSEVFTKLQEYRVKNIDTLEGKVQIEKLQIGGENTEALLHALNDNSIAPDKLKIFKTSPDQHEVTLVRIKPNQRFKRLPPAGETLMEQFKNIPKILRHIIQTMDYKAEQWGLDICSEEIVANFALQHKDEPDMHAILPTTSHDYKLSSQEGHSPQLTAVMKNILEEYPDDVEFVFLLPEKPKSRSLIETIKRRGGRIVGRLNYNLSPR